MAFTWGSVLCACAAVLLSGCGAGADTWSPILSNAHALIKKSTSPQTFNYTGAEQSFVVPLGVKHVRVTASGASGAICMGYRYCYYGFGVPGNGGLIAATIAVTPGETLYIFVGGDNGYNGGGVCASSSCGYQYLNGGGASDVRRGGDGLANRVVVAGGGGGPGTVPFEEGVGGDGGLGGGKKGTAGSPGGGSLGTGGGGAPGTQRHGGSGGPGDKYQVQPRRCRDGCGHCSGKAGADGVLGNGGAGADYCGGPGGGGGGGYYGGGGGGSGAQSYYGQSFEYGAGGGGGGGSSFAEKRALKVEDKPGGAAPGNGQIMISWK